MISVIVPSYNCAKYIGETIDSILSQTYEDFELIIIEDGSTDNTKDILSKYSDSRLHIIYDTNHGVSHARNLGIQQANGELIAFVDADDVLEKDYLKCLVNAIADSDYARCNYNKLSDGNKKQDEILLNLPSKTTGLEILKRIITSIENLQGNIWASLFRKDIIKNHCICFNEKISFGEDLLFSVEYLSHVNKASIIHESFYNYRINIESTTGKYMSKMQESLILANKKLKPIIDRINNKTISEGFIRVKANSVLICFYNNRNKGNPFSIKARKNELKKMIDIPEYLDAIRFEIHNPLKGKYWIIRNLHYRLLLLTHGYKF